MADIRRYWLVRHLRSDTSHHVLHYRRGRLVASGRGLSYWFSPMSASVAEVPVDDQEVPLAVEARTADYQDVTVQGVLTLRVTDPEALASRVDFTIDTARGVHLKQPLEKLALLVAQLAQQHATDWVGQTPVRDVLRVGAREVRDRVHSALEADDGLARLGLTVVSTRVSSIAPTPDLERALEAPMRERIQQEADQAAFERRALAVEKERAIKENELKNEIELARREEELIAQRGLNMKRQAVEDAEAKRIATDAEASRSGTIAAAQSESIRLVDGAKVEQERARMEIQERVPPLVLAALAARELAGKLQRIDHLHLGGDALGPLLSELAAAGTRALERKEGATP
ncbi:MAG: band 7 protein [Polyangiaceae bacterium]|jgi:regulator of protease activity HflC (stomatin/prohibitin superfamily)|nr:band 7 protein [Polyangiaceae bacterium]MBK8938304.1 band 7 protein [Polyangiaceae bacterium]